LSGGTFILGGNLNVGSGINLTTNSSTLTLQGGTIMSGATNALASLNKNTKSLTLANTANFTTTGNFNNTGSMTINNGSTFAVTGNLTNYSSGTKTLTGGIFTVGGTLSASGLDIQGEVEHCR
jgi:autotransporter family porin